MKLPRKDCPRCARDVAWKAGKPVRHKCPHGELCMQASTTCPGPYCYDCARVLELAHEIGWDEAELDAVTVDGPMQGLQADVLIVDDVPGGAQEVKLLDEDEAHAKRAAELEKLGMKLMDKEDAAEYTRSLPYYHFRLRGRERDGTRFDCMKRLRMDCEERARQILIVTALVNYGAALDVVELRFVEWPN